MLHQPSVCLAEWATMYDEMNYISNESIAFLVLCFSWNERGVKLDDSTAQPRVPRKDAKCLLVSAGHRQQAVINFKGLYIIKYDDFILWLPVCVNSPNVFFSRPKNLGMMPTKSSNSHNVHLMWTETPSLHSYSFILNSVCFSQEPKQQKQSVIVHPDRSVIMVHSWAWSESQHDVYYTAESHKKAMCSAWAHRWN